MSDDLLEMRCSSCRQRLGWTFSPGATRSAVFCDTWCAYETTITPQEERNSHWGALVELGVSPVQVARIYGVAHPLVYKTLSRQ